MKKIVIGYVLLSAPIVGLGITIGLLHGWLAILIVGITVAVICTCIYYGVVLLVEGLDGRKD